mmetsp:Transcript_18496/g.33064  ORF Transcript_18496/g.33064 Transcript_18496/m.33064 type:complete len:397 (+) Transcript_18496:192-1382(+)
MLVNLNDIVQQANRLKPTATVVRQRNGDIKLERSELLHETQRCEAIEASRRAGKVRGESSDAARHSGSLCRLASGATRQPKNVCHDYVPRTYTLAEMADAKKELEETGLVVFRDVIDDDLQARYTDAMWSWLYRRSGQKVLRNDSKTWENSKWPGAFLPGIQSEDGLCHLPIVWEVREKAASFFEGMYSTSELLVSFDGANIMRPTKGPHGSAKYLTPRHWLHVDSDRSIPAELSGHQGVVSISGMDGTDHEGGCFQAVLGSHIDDFQNFFRDTWSNGNGNVSLPLSETNDYLLVPYIHELRTRMSRVIAPDRSLIIWKNEIFHCNSPNFSDRFRFAQYVNCYPSVNVSEKTRRERMIAFSQGIGSTHRVDVFRPSTEPCRNFVPPHLSEKQQALL